jgi:hypothetical protein
VLNAKHAFRQLGYYDVPSYGLTPYPDQPLFDGVRAYQKDNDLTVDGTMMPGGETEQSINKILAITPAEGENGDQAGCAQEAMLLPPGLPWIRRRNYCPVPRVAPRKQDCDKQINDDEREYRRIKKRYGDYRAQRCWASAYVRHANCIAGRPDFPPLDTGEY